MLECTYGAHKQHANFESKEGSSKEAETRGARDGKTLEATSQTKKKKTHKRNTKSVPKLKWAKEGEGSPTRCRW